MTTLFDTGRSLRRAGIALAAGASLFAMAGAAFATPVAEARITSVGAAWGPITGGTGITYTPGQPQGGPEAEVRWGTPSGGSAKSGYNFTGVGTPTGWTGTDVDFELGDFTHFNNPISSGTSITQAVLTLTFGVDFRLDGGTATSKTFSASYLFKHDETSNGSEDWWGNWSNPSTCANGPNGDGVNSNGCSDNVKVFLNQGQEHAFDDGEGNEYFLSITGFLLGGNVVNDFWTKEEADSTAALYARFTANPNVAPIPLPAAAWLLIGGIGAIGAVSRRRKAAAAA